jgi:hypothetical protein
MNETTTDINDGGRTGNAGWVLWLGAVAFGLVIGAIAFVWQMWGTETFIQLAQGALAWCM